MATISHTGVAISHASAAILMKRVTISNKNAAIHANSKNVKILQFLMQKSGSTCTLNMEWVPFSKHKKLKSMKSIKIPHFLNIYILCSFTTRLVANLLFP